MDSETKDQLAYVENGRVKAIIDLDITHEDMGAPSMRFCRHAILTIQNKDVDGNDCTGYVVYDRWLCRIVNGVFYGDRDAAVGVAHSYNIYPDSPQDMSPNGAALGLIYPEIEREETAS